MTFYSRQRGEGERVFPGHVLVLQCARCVAGGNIFIGFYAQQDADVASGHKNHLQRARQIAVGNILS